MRVRALKELTFRTSKGRVAIKPGQVFKPADPQRLLDAGLVAVLPPDQTGVPQAARIFSKILNEEVWVVTHPDALSLVPEGAVVYLPEEIRNLKGASPEDIQAIHRVKRELGGKLIAVNQREDKAVV